jgi:uncharacterized RDD family membrane protein YckC/type II secretory pathway pseudopilin PulG
MARTHYDLLEVARTASVETIASAYESLVQRQQSETNRDFREAWIAKYKGAYDVLSDPERRRAYDAELDAAEVPSMAVPGQGGPGGIYAATAAELGAYQDLGSEALALEGFQNGAWSGFWRRVGAQFIDGIILYVGFLLLGAIAFLLTKNPLAVLSILYGGYIALYLGYNAVMNASEAMGTWGRRALRIAVVSAETGGQISLGRSFGRACLSLLSGIFIIPNLVQLFTGKRQSVSDLLTGTVVVRKGNKGVSGAVIAVLAVFFGIFVIGILAAVALPAYQQSTSRAKLTLALVDVRNVSVLAELHYLTTGKIETSLDALGYQSGPRPKPYTLSIDARTMVITATGNMFPSKVPVTIGLSPSKNPGGGLTWTCVSSGIPDAALPLECQRRAGGS